MLDCERFSLIVNRIPPQADSFTAPEAIERTEDHGKLNRLTFHGGKQRFKLLLIVKRSDILLLARALHTVCRVVVDKTNLYGILQRFSDIRMTMNNRVCRDFLCIQRILVVVLNILWCQVFQQNPLILEIRNDLALDDHTIRCIG